MTSKAFALSALLLVLAACGDDKITTPTPPAEPAPNIAGSYSTQWLTQFIRPHDGYSGSWTCAGSLTIVQSPGANSFTGFGVVNAPCPAVSFDLVGRVDVGGAIRFDTGGPRAGAGPCPPPPVSTYTGTLSKDFRQLSARSTKVLNCPGEGEGEYDFTQIVTGYKNF
ncbi:MAG TPA: hypothetical protein VGN09_24085 [Vicinamibacteria bacterium]|jgi:hypothetical protein